MARKKRGNRALRDLDAELLSVEFAAGSDGLLRGHPDPVFLTAAFLIGDAGAVALGRGLNRLRPKGRYPFLMELEGEVVLDCRLPAGFERVLLLTIALEEDGGGDVASLYADLDKVPEDRKSVV